MLSKTMLEDLYLRGGEGAAHKALKKRAIQILKRLGARSVILEAKVKGVKGRVDVVGYWRNTTVAVECGDTPEGKIISLKSHCDIVVHMPYCWTPKLYRDQDLERRIQQEKVKA